MISKLNEYFANDPVKALALSAALVALASTPIAFAVLGRMNWFEARRGRVMLKPAFASIVASMLLVMGIPAIFAALVIKSEDFDRDRYEFDPNKTWSVLEQGRGYKSVEEADAAVKVEMARLADERKNLVDNVKKLDDAMLTLRAATAQSPATAQALPAVLERLAGIRRSVGVDGPQQLMDFTAPPAALPAAPAMAMAGVAPVVTAQPLAPAASGLDKTTAEAELSTVPEPQKSLASMLPLVDIPAGWTVSQYGTKHLETFNADNLFEKIDGRAESFTQNDVIGMAYTSYHPTGDDTNEVQLYIFEFDHSKPYRAQSKYTSEKPDEYKTVPIGTEGYASAGSLLFFVDPYYTQIVSTTDDPKFAAFAAEIARRIAALQTPTGSASADGAGGEKAVDLSTISFGLLPSGSGRSEPKFVAQDAFGYGFLSEVFMADYKDGDVTWQGYIRPYGTVEEARKVFEEYLSSAKRDGGNVKEIEAAGADRMILNENVGLIDAIFLKGNVVGGANGSTDAAKAETFARDFVKNLPDELPKPPPAEKKSSSPAEGEEG
ncbi:DUF6599 family protein [Tundrisphaera lichenicola]|uniref:DUF6599 family protein n=1 Tax=Tundrisphaera lichenicola TaxID=2029860 RepID=UPI003EBCB82C